MDVVLYSSSQQNFIVAQERSKVLSIPKSSETRKRVGRKWTSGDTWRQNWEANKSPEQIFDDGIEAVHDLLQRRIINWNQANKLLSAMMASYITYTVRQQLNDALADSIANTFTANEYSNNV